MRGPSLSDLPDEVLYCILCYTPPQAAVAVEQTSHRFQDIVNHPLLWRLYCRSHFNFWDAHHDVQRKFESPVASVDWKRLFIARQRIDRAITEILDSILASQRGRIAKFHTIVKFGYDAKDTLLRQSGIGPANDDYLARRYYSNAILTCLHRTTAIPLWNKLRGGEAVGLERALGAFDMFILETGSGDLDDISNWLEEICTKLLMANPDVGNLTPREKAIAIADYLRKHNLTGIEAGREYYDVEHNFLGLALKDSDHNSLPLISAAIYCYVARKFNLDAQPCGFPFHVHVVIRPGDGFDMDGRRIDDGREGEPLYMDPFRSSSETPLLHLQNQLSFLGEPATTRSPFLSESGVPEIVLRCSKNIFNSMQQMRRMTQTQLDTDSIKYAALWASMLFAGASSNTANGAGPTVYLRQLLPWLMELFATHYPADVHLVEQFLVPLFQNLPEYEHLIDSIHVMRAGDDIPKQVRRRTAEHAHVKYRIGQVFRHRRYHYRAVITGWDAECDAGEQWMRTMGVDRLRGGRHQSFYHVLVEDKSVRYVAEENIEIITPDLSESSTVLFKLAGKHFKRWDPSTRTFVSNIRDEYPDD